MCPIRDCRVLGRAHTSSRDPHEPALLILPNTTMRTTTRALTIAALTSVANAAWDTNENYCAALADYLKCEMAYTTESTCTAGGCSWDSSDESCSNSDATGTTINNMYTEMGTAGFPTACYNTDVMTCTAPLCKYGSTGAGCGPAEDAATTAMTQAGVPAAALALSKMETEKYECANSQSTEAFCNLIPECKWNTENAIAYCGASDEWRVAAVYEACGTSDDLTTAAGGKGFTPQQAAAKVGPAGTTGSFALALSALAGAAALAA